MKALDVLGFVEVLLRDVGPQANWGFRGRGDSWVALSS